MEHAAELAEILLSDQSTFAMIWRAEQGWEITGDGCESLDKEGFQENGLLQLFRIVSEADSDLCHNYVEKILSGQVGAEDYCQLAGNRMKVDLHLRTKKDYYGYYEILCRFQKDKRGAIIRMTMEIQELSAEAIYRIQLAQVITNDKNPAFFNRTVQAILQKNPDKKYALIQFDVAKFKMINEQFGETVGDELLNYFIETLKLYCNENQLYVRLTADVFMIFTDYQTQEDILQFIEEIRSHLLGYKGISYRLVFGICFVSDITKPLRQYGDGAAFARQSIKGDALNYVAFYRDEMKENARIRKFVEDNMEQALKNREFVMYLQPKYSISKNEMVGAEALARWIHPKQGLIAPGDFVPLFEQNGFIVKMDEYIWEEACKTIRQWMDAGMKLIPISVNLSRRHLKNERFIQVLNGLIEKYRVPKRYLEIEITETVEVDGLGKGIDLLKQNGFTLLMDDFGSGYSSLNTLKDTRFDVIKIDRGFLQDFIGSQRGQKIVEHTIKMTKSIGLDLVAEGVETREQAVFLSDCGCDTAQGFYYAKPMSLEEFNQQIP